MSPELASFVQTLIEALTPVLLAGLSYLGLLLTRLIAHRVRSERAQHAVVMAHDAVADVVAAGGAAFRRELVKAMADGVVTPEEREAIRQAVLAEARAQAGHEVTAVLSTMTNDPDAWLWTKIRAEAHATRAEGGTDPDPAAVVANDRAKREGWVAEGVILR